MTECLNGKRAGDLSYLTLKEFHVRSRFGPVDYVVRVVRHKGKSKPCNTNYLGDLQFMVPTFIELIRVTLLGNSSCPYFTTSAGTKMTSGQYFIRRELGQPYDSYEYDRSVL